MPANQEPRSNIYYGWSATESGWGDQMNNNLRLLGVIGFQGSINSIVATLPVSPAIGESHLVTGDNTVYYWNGSEWLEFAPSNGWRVWNQETLQMLYFDDADWSGKVTADSIQLTGGTGGQGTLSWNVSEETLDLVQDGAVLQLGQELQTHVFNDTGVSISNGTPVMYAGTTGITGLIKVAPMDGTDPANAGLYVGIATEDIADQTSGKITKYGKVRNLDTSPYSEGAILYISPLVIGALTATEPSDSQMKLATAAVVSNHPTDGTLLVDAARVDANAGVTSVAGKKNYMGVETVGAMSFDDGTHVFSITSVKYWYKGEVFETISPVTCDLDSFGTVDAETLFFIYFDDASGVLTASEGVWNLDEHVPVATVAWNGTTHAIGYEAHYYDRDISWHKSSHNTIGTRYQSGFSQTYPSAGTPNQIDIIGGTIWDEDIKIDISEQTSARLWYQTSTGFIFETTPTTLPYKINGSVLQYVDTDTWALADLTAAQYINVFVYATNDVDYPLYILLESASAPYSNVSNARDASPPDLGQHPFNPESKLLYRWIFKGDGTFMEATDYRSSSPIPSGGTSATSASAVTFTPSGDISSGNVQGAIEELDNEKVSKVASTDNAIARYNGTIGVIQNSSVYIDDNGRLGVRIAAPLADMHVEGTGVGSKPSFALTEGTGSRLWHMGLVSSNELAFGYGTQVDTNKLLSLDVNGNLGIGGTPTAKFDVIGSVGRFQIPSTGNSAKFTRDGANYIIADGGASAGLFLQATNALGLDVNGVRRLAVDSSGNVGIGVTPALGTLQVKTKDGTNTAFNLLNNSSNISNILFSQYGTDGSTGYTVISGDARTSGHLAFSTNATERMRIDASGNVSIKRTDGSTLAPIVERGSNSNGEYIKYADGTMIQTHDITIDTAISTSVFGGYRSIGIVWDYPSADFISVDSFSITPYNSTAFGSYASSIGLTSALVLLTSISSQSSATRYLKVMAIGRWY